MLRDDERVDERVDEPYEPSACSSGAIPRPTMKQTWKRGVSIIEGEVDEGDWVSEPLPIQSVSVPMHLRTNNQPMDEEDLHDAQEIQEIMKQDNLRGDAGRVPPSTPEPDASTGSPGLQLPEVNYTRPDTSLSFIEEPDEDTKLYSSESSTASLSDTVSPSTSQPDTRTGTPGSSVSPFEPAPLPEVNNTRSETTMAFIEEPEQDTKSHPSASSTTSLSGTVSKSSSQSVTLTDTPGSSMSSSESVPPPKVKDTQPDMSMSFIDHPEEDKKLNSSSISTVSLLEKDVDDIFNVEEDIVLVEQSTELGSGADIEKNIEESIKPDPGKSVSQ